MMVVYLWLCIWAKGVGYVQSCGTAAVAVAKYTGKDIIKCHGGEYKITRTATLGR